MKKKCCSHFFSCLFVFIRAATFRTEFHILITGIATCFITANKTFCWFWFSTFTTEVAGIDCSTSTCPSFFLRFRFSTFTAEVTTVDSAASTRPCWLRLGWFLLHKERIILLLLHAAIHISTLSTCCIGHSHT